ncbi:hypothetical protein NVP1131O_04 [Vibrio phage 1.131.O._10N.222.49.A8]|nr:hypothetical protein NVP1131O_04 [Vibrio phage 1.131.O._10N.222.49.A8]
MKIKITPEIAKEILKKNIKNRKLNKSHVSRLANEMLSGNWSYTGDAIKVSTDDVLVDGQHRLEAVISSGVSIDIELITGVSKDSFSKIDSGLKRSAGQVVQMSGMKNPNNVAAIAKVMLNIKDNGGVNGNFAITAKRYSNCAIHSEAERIHDDLDESQIIPKMKKEKINTPTQAAMFWLYMNNDKDLVNDFVDHVSNGLFSSSDDPCKRLKDKLTDMRGSTSMLFATTAMALTFKAWNAFVEGKKIKRLSHSVESAFPSPKEIKWLANE